jgi:hypothetical protein
MGKTQQTFAVEVLKSAIGTVARYETSDPPQGAVLLRLRDIAREQGLYELANRFDLLFRGEVLQNNLPSQMVMVPATETHPAHGQLDVSLSGEDALSGAQSFLLILAQLTSHDPKIRQNAVAALTALQSAARKYTNPAVGEIQDAFRSMQTGQPPSSVKGKRSKQ